ncbi:Raucaffricine beta-glucosidase [Handroanthus impetiginosus]|uniref:Raucaffricine beta-glucosidase n=1 Tax=Handroanthus impetiginosus TaxID=429701 RepID=A0A2G9H7X7_9LAMI|nr:Raucaffricine beta-glucosidase [Handroanthus impetiginosus]
MGDQGRNNLAIVTADEVPAVPIEQDNSNIRRGDFPEGFIFGSGTSAYQVEGAHAADGKGLSIWDDFTLRTPDRINDGSNGVVACDMYYRYKEDIRAMKAMGFDAYRFSIAWTRILPGGRPSAGINRKGIEYYNDVIDTVIAHGMKPFVTLYHWDLPDILQKEYHGLFSRKVVDDFKEFVEICFWEFGDRVKDWTTLNEPWTVTTFGYVDGTFPPSKASCPPELAATKIPGHKTGLSKKSSASVPITRPYSDVKYDTSDPAKDAYTVARNLLLCHAAAVNIYRTKFQVWLATKFQTHTWTTLNEPWTVTTFGYVDGTFPPSKASCPPELAATKLPAHKSGLSKKSSESVPITRPYSDVKYDTSDPAKDAYTVARNLLLCHAEAVKIYRTKFQGFQKGQIGIVLNSHWAKPKDPKNQDDVDAAKRAVDFMLGWFLNPVLYGRYPQNMIDFVPPENLAPFSPQESEMLKGSIDFLGINYYMTYYAENDPNPEGVGYHADMRVHFTNFDESGLNVCPEGIYEKLVYIKNTYPDIPPIIITENGIAEQNDKNKTAKQACVDPDRVKYHQNHLAYILKAINEVKSDVTGYFVWSWCDNFEWAQGYTLRFGINYVDFMNNQTRYPKDSAKWFAKFLGAEKEKTVGSVSNKRSIEENSGNVPGKRFRAA